jgi:hypothetical protein
MVVSGPIASTISPITTPVATVVGIAVVRSIAPTPIRIIGAVSPAPTPGETKAYTWPVVRIGIIVSNINAGSVAIRIVIVPITIGVITIVIAYTI